VTLLDIKKKMAIKVLRIADDSNRVNLIRLGVCEGDIITAEKILMGPILVNDTICVGRNLAKRIEVEWIP